MLELGGRKECGRNIAEKMGWPENQKKNLRTATLMKMETGVQLAEGLIMVVLFKACVSFHFRAVKDWSPVITVVFWESRLAEEMVFTLPFQLVLTFRSFGSEAYTSHSATCCPL